MLYDYDKATLVKAYMKVKVDYQKVTFMENYESCSVVKVIKLINGKWKPFILFLLSKEPHSFNEIWRRIPKVSKKVLSTHLKEMIQDELILSLNGRYDLSKTGKSLMPLLLDMQEWSSRNLKDVIIDTESVLLPKT